MKMYLSSFKLGNETAKLKELLSGTNGHIAYIPNALDFVGADRARRDKQIQENMHELDSLGAETKLLDLEDYFGKQEELKQYLRDFGGVYVQGGNTFVLRQAYRLSGFDAILMELNKRTDFVYIAYSAGVCVLTPDLRTYAITDDADNFPYKECIEQIWDGLGILDFTFEPHYQSDHPESASTDKEVEYCIENKILFRAYHDGEVLIIE
jgi:dipeptidase E